MNSAVAHDFLGLILRSVLVVIIVTIGLGLTGCNEQMARIEDNQLKLEVMIEANAEQIAILAANMEQNQYDIEERVENAHNDTRNMAGDVAAVTDAQIKLREMVQGSNRALYNRMSMIEQAQHEMQTGIKDVQNDTQTVVSNVNAVSNEQTRLHEIVQNNGSYMADRMDVIEQQQQQWQNMFAGFKDNVQKVIARVNNLEQNLSNLREVVQNGVQDLISVMDSADNERLQYKQDIEEKIQSLSESMSAIQRTQEQNLFKLQEIVQNGMQDLVNVVNSADSERLQYRQDIDEKIQALSESMDTILQNQFELRTQIEDVQQTTETMKNEIPEALEYMKERELSRSVESVEFEKPIALYTPIENNN